jgi:hypothetical protein
MCAHVGVCVCVCVCAGSPVLHVGAYVITGIGDIRALAYTRTSVSSCVYTCVRASARL